MSTEYDTIIIGLGAAGTTAASVLARGGRRVLALEALDRVGGRVHTQSFGDGVVEVGAEWMHGQFPNRVYDAAVEHNVTVLPQELERTVLCSDGSQASATVQELIEVGMGFSDDVVNQTEPLGQYVTRRLMDWIREKKPEVLNDQALITEVLAFLNLAVNNYEASNDWNDVNAKTSYVELDGDQHMSWHRHGYKTYFDIMLNKYKDGPGLPSLDIKLSTEVTQISWPADPQQPVTVTCRDGSVYSADTAIVTVSLGVLKERHSSLFSKPLPENKVTAIEKVEFGCIDKIILAFPNAWWPTRNTSYIYMWTPSDVAKVPSEDMWTTQILGATLPTGSSNTVTLWTSGNTSKLIETLPEDLVKRKSMELLRRFMGANTTIPEPTGIIRTKWYTNRFARGTYSYDSIAAASLPGARAALAAPLTDSGGRARVLFAGEATHETAFSTVHGAADSGYREAQRLLNQTCNLCTAKE